MTEPTNNPKCPGCGHVHQGPKWAGICIGCPCPIRPEPRPKQKRVSR